MINLNNTLMIVIKIKNNSSKNLVQCIITKDLKQVKEAIDKLKTKQEKNNELIK